MSDIMIQLFDDFKVLGYRGGTKLEDWCQSELEKSIKHVSKIDFKANGKILAPNTFIRNPYGSNGHPDFLINIDGRLFALENKSCLEATRPMWNSAIPEPDCIYFFSHKSYKGRNPRNFIFMGKTVMDEKEWHDTNLVWYRANLIKKNQKIGDHKFYIRMMVEDGYDYFNNADMNEMVARNFVSKDDVSFRPKPFSLTPEQKLMIVVEEEKQHREREISSASCAYDFYPPKSEMNGSCLLSLTSV